MHATVDVQEFRAAVSRAAKAVSGRSTLPILHNVKLTVGEDLTIEGTDLSASIRTRVLCDPIAPGSVTVNAKLLLEALSTMPKKALAIKADDKSVVSLVCGKIAMDINGLPADEFPPMPKEDGGTFSLSGDVLKGIVDKVGIAVSDDETRVRLCGVNLRGGDQLRATGTDTHRMSTMACDVQVDVDLIVPLKAMQMAAELGDVEVSVGDHIAFDNGTTRLVSRVIDGEFPDYRKVIPEKNMSFSCDRDLLVSAIKRCAVVANKDNCKVAMAIQKNSLTLSATSSKIGSAEEDIPIENNGVEDGEAAFNTNYLLDGLKLDDSDSVTIHFAQFGSGPILIEGSADYVVMPMQLL